MRLGGHLAVSALLCTLACGADGRSPDDRPGDTATGASQPATLAREVRRLRAFARL